MNPYEISICVRLNPVSDPFTASDRNNSDANEDAMVYGILPDQEAIDEVMRQLYAIGMKLIQTNSRSSMVSELARELQTVLEPSAACLN